jgi:hypothetical protein
MAGQPALEVSREIAATPDEVWRHVSNLAQMKNASPELVGTWSIGSPRLGTRCVNLNRRKAVVWPTLSRITRWKPPSHDGGRGVLAFHVWPTDVEWSYELEPTASGTGTVLTERRSALIDPSAVVRFTARVAMGGAEGHDAELLSGMHRTLEHYRTIAER